MFENKSVKRQCIGLRWSFILLGRWIKANYAPVCFSVKGNQYGSFKTPSHGKLAAIKLVHLYGYVSCDSSIKSSWTYWGCASPCYPKWRGRVGVTITNSANYVLLPTSHSLIAGTTTWYKIPGYHSLSPELVLSFFANHHSVSSGEELRLWYGEDLLDYTEGDNDGKTCCDVYAIFV